MSLIKTTPEQASTIGQAIAERPDIVNFGGEWFGWKTTHWEQLGKIAGKQFINRAAVEVSGDSALKRNQFNEVLHSLEAYCQIVDEFDTDGGTISLQNGLLDVLSGELRDHRPDFRNLNTLPFNYDPNAGRPEAWMAFLDSIWGDQPDLIEFLQLWIGFQMVPDTTQQRFVNLIGPKRSGKGTIAHVMNSLVGPANVGALSIDGIAARFGLEGAIGKLSLIMSETRIGYSDKDAVINKLLQITGEDVMQCDRKFVSPWIGKLSGRITVLSNDTLKLPEPVLMSRMIVLPMTESFDGREDTELKGKLDAEMGAIFLWALEGCQRVLNGKRLEQPESGKEACAQQLEDMKKPIDRFMDEVLIDTSDEKGERFKTNNAIYSRFVTWSEDRGDRRPMQRDAAISAIHGSRLFVNMKRGARGFWVAFHDDLPI